MDDTTVKVLLGVITALLALSSALVIALLANLRSDVKEIKGDVKETRAASTDVSTRLQVIEAQLGAKVDQVDKKMDLMLGLLNRRIEQIEIQVIDLTRGDEPRAERRPPQP